ncbi:MAG TPA: hypothetical protein PKB10_05335 [Tepidisphaeraceae bacterium]|nr:hypothetical protein [Tepidisphaeraceae bacterium]
MTTARQIQKLWQTHDYKRLARLCLEARADALEPVIPTLACPVGAAALALLRLTELSPFPTPMHAGLAQVLANHQHNDGGWGEPVLTAIAVRALLLADLQRDRASAGMANLGRLQRDDGLWPGGGTHRLPGDPVVTLFVLLQLGTESAFRFVTRIDRAIEAIDTHPGLDAPSRRALAIARLRTRTPVIHPTRLAIPA